MRLHALGGEMAPPQIMADLRVVLELPARAKEHFWEALGPCLRDPLPPEMEAHLTRFCEAFGVPDADLGNAIRACRFLLREASLRDLSRGAFADDVARLSAGAAGAAGAEELSGLLLAGFEAAKKVVRGEVLAATLADHGKLVESIEWRTDMVSSSSRGDKIQIPVVWLTLGYREGERRDRISLQLTPEAVQSLKRVCERLGSS
ncbi:Hypothetical protein CAP_2739 [Chondromyces apiculatus DSM 436]|uniref:COMM domain-containing protein n=1 Tax=Chondromyces apiculatus DSM 436 TaxID=1192034 RepID=A0A017THX1_9BACT|nr:Hypothetical protein CAP_2739 [Chondromyces apiculatus DSM 436]